MCHFAFRIQHYNVDNGRALIFVCLLNVWTGCRVGPERTARTFVLIAAYVCVCERVIKFDCVIDWRSTQYEDVIVMSSHAPFCLPNTLHVSSWTNSAYVYAVFMYVR